MPQRPTTLASIFFDAPWLARAWAAAVFVIAAMPGRADENVAPTEYQMKAAYLYSFIKFVEWPASATRDPQAPIVIGVLGQDPFGKDLESVIEGKRINERPLLIKRLPPGAAAAGCHVLFVAPSERRRLPQIFRELENSPTLTVGDGMEGFCQNDGMINFVMESSKVRFQINNKAVERHGLKISSKLLRLAVPSAAAAPPR